MNLMPILSNPFANTKPKAGEALYQESESLSVRIRDMLLFPLFHHKKQSFLFIALIVLIGLSLCVVPWLFPALALGLAMSLTVVGGLISGLTLLSVYINSYLLGWEDTNT
ncbi:MAG: hypothetical protein PSV35_07130, partial [bacterium]|nr:hypothetical protein [bacterium]